MRVAVIYIAAGGSGKLKDLAGALARGFGASGHRAEVFDAVPQAIAAFDYVAFGSEAAGLGASLPDKVLQTLKSAPGLEGKRCFAFVRKSGLRPARLLGRLMYAMEAAGMRVSYSEILAGAAEAETAARNAPVERNQARG